MLDEGEGVCILKLRRCGRRVRTHQTVSAVMITAMAPTPTAMPMIAPTPRTVFDIVVNGLLCEGEPDAEPDAIVSDGPPLPVAVEPPVEVDEGLMQLLSVPASTGTDELPPASPATSLISN